MLTQLPYPEKEKCWKNDCWDQSKIIPKIGLGITILPVD